MGRIVNQRLERTLNAIRQSLLGSLRILPKFFDAPSPLNVLQLRLGNILPQHIERIRRIIVHKPIQINPTRLLQRIPV